MIRGIGLCIPMLMGALAACAPVPDPSAGLTADETIALIDQVEASDVALAEIAEAFAIGTRSTDVQREALEAELIGRRVEWDIPVYEVSLENGRYKVTSQAMPIRDPEAAPTIRVVAFVVPRGEPDESVLNSVKTGDPLRIRGIVQEIQLRTIVAVIPASLANQSASKP